MLEIENLECARGYNTLFHSLNFSLHPGTALHVRGANGCGKTSLLRILATLGRAEQGQVKWNGIPVLSNRPAYLEHVSYHGHQIGLKGDLSAKENLQFAIKLQTMPAKPNLQEVLQQLQIEHAAELPCSLLSAGQRQRVAIARTILSEAQLWIMDEPGTALDQSGLVVFEDLLCKHVNNGGMVIFTSHHDFVLEGANQQELELDRFTE